jgi:uncharacterized protein (DUF58 family)
VLTRAGWAIALLAAGLVAAGRLLGIFELFLLGAAGVVLVVGAVVVVRRTPLRLDVSRTLHPPRVHAGSPSRVELSVRNRSTRRTPLLTVRDPVGRGRTATVALAPLGQAQTIRAAYRLPTERRGILRVGPLAVEVTDPFGLAGLSTTAAPVTELTVWPAVVDVDPLPHTLSDDPHGGADQASALASGGEDFYALRAYEPGDDLRRVHWRSTARWDELLVRQDERPWQGRATVVLDARRGSHSVASFERAVSAAASVVVACWRRHFLLRLVDTTGYDSGAAAGTAHVEALLERLAAVEPVEGGRLGATVAALRRPGNGGACAVLLGEPGTGDVERLGRLRPPYGALAVVAFPPARRGRPTDAATASVPIVEDDDGFRDAWRSALRRTRRPAGAVG